MLLKGLNLERLDIRENNVWCSLYQSCPSELTDGIYFLKNTQLIDGGGEQTGFKMQDFLLLQDTKTLKLIQALPPALAYSLVS